MLKKCLGALLLMFIVAPAWAQTPPPPPAWSPPPLATQQAQATPQSPQTCTLVTHEGRRCRHISLPCGDPQLQGFHYKVECGIETSH
jgi:hypothetical protein